MINRVFEALSHPDRRKLLALLKRRGELHVGAIGEHFDFTKPTLSHHLRLLVDAGLLDREKRGQFVYYRINVSAFEEVLGLLIQLFETSTREKERAMKRVLMACLGLAMAAVAMSAAVWNRIPDPMAIHWDAGGRADSFGSKTVGLLLCPAVMVLLPLLLGACFKLDPRRAHVERSSGALGAIVIGFGVYMLAIHALIIRAALSGDARLDHHLLATLVGGLFVLIGLVLPKLRSNWFAGIRTPWTLSSERVWHLTHRLAGWTFIFAGLAVVVLAWLIKGSLLFGVAMAVIGAAALVPVVYSYVCYAHERADAAAHPE